MGAVRAGSLTASVTVIACLAGCDPGTARRQQLNSENPLDRTEAIVQAYETRDQRAVHRLVGLLDDPSAAVRMYAIQALRRLCGVDYGYRYYASPAQREAAVERWRQALRSGEVVLRPSAPLNVSNQEEAPPAAGAAP
jgi:HEAT repeat protein